MAERIDEDKIKSYLNSIRWQQIRKVKLEEVGNMCEKCGFPHELNVHHKHYDTFGCEDLEDLGVLCKRCHADYHFFKYYR